MKKAFITISIAFAISFQMVAQQKIVFEETIYDFDTIMQNSDGEHIFKFTNEGNAPLLITSAFSSCGCVIPEWPREPIVPSTKSNIKVKYNTGKLGPFTKVIVVKSNDPASPKTVLRINGVVKEPPQEQKQ